MKKKTKPITQDVEDDPVVAVFVKRKKGEPLEDFRRRQSQAEALFEIADYEHPQDSRVLH